MPKEHIDGLISQLHDRIATSETSPEQEALLEKMQHQVNGWEDPGAADELRATAEILFEEWEEKHPTMAIIVKDIIRTLHDAGL